MTDDRIGSRSGAVPYFVYGIRFNPIIGNLSKSSDVGIGATFAVVTED